MGEQQIDVENSDEERANSTKFHNSVYPLDGGELLWGKYNNINPRSAADFSNHHYFLFPMSIKGFTLKNKNWSKSVAWPDLILRL
jgi:hypothetical protein